MLSSMLVSPLPPSLLDTYDLSTSSLRCNGLYMVISFLVLWSICLSSSLIHFKNGPEYLTRKKAQILIPLTRFLLWSSGSSEILFFKFFSFISTCLIVSASQIPKYLSSSSCRAASTDIPDLLSPLLPIIHRLWQVFRVTSRVLT